MRNDQKYLQSSLLLKSVTNTKWIACLILAVVLCDSALGQSTGYRKIINFGCHNTDGTCYAYLEGDVFGPTACTASSVRWNAEADPNGKAILTLLAGAFFADKRVAFNLLDNCYPYQTEFPTIRFINIEP